LLVQILSNTPIWVFVSFFVLIVFGLMQTRTRTVQRIPALLLPAGMIALSLFGIGSSFGLSLIPVASWAIALSMAALVGYALFRDKGVEYDATTEKFLVPGSWVPLGVLTAIFFCEICVRSHARLQCRGYLCAALHPFLIRCLWPT